MTGYLPRTYYHLTQLWLGHDGFGSEGPLPTTDPKFKKIEGSCELGFAFYTYARPRLLDYTTQGPELLLPSLRNETLVQITHNHDTQTIETQAVDNTFSWSFFLKYFWCGFEWRQFYLICKWVVLGWMDSSQPVTNLLVKGSRKSCNSFNFCKFLKCTSSAVSHKCNNSN